MGTSHLTKDCSKKFPPFCISGELLHLAVKYQLPALTKHLELQLARWEPSLACLLHHLVLCFLYLPSSDTYDHLLQEAKKRRGLFETEDWARVESSYPKLASLVLNRAINDCN